MTEVPIEREVVSAHYRELFDTLGEEDTFEEVTGTPLHKHELNECTEATLVHNVLEASEHLYLVTITHHPLEYYVFKLGQSADLHDDC